MKRVMMIGCMLAAGFISKAQEFTDEELTKYATVMVWADQETDKLKNIVRDSVEIWLDGMELTNALYNDLSKADKKDALGTVTVTEVQLGNYRDIQARIEEKKDTFKARYKSKIIDEIGGSLYNKLKAALKNDDEVLVRYEAIFNALQNPLSESNDSEQGVSN